MKAATIIPWSAGSLLFNSRIAQRFNLCLEVGGELASVQSQPRFRFLSNSVIIRHIYMFYPSIEVQIYGEMEVIYFISSPVRINQCGQWCCIVHLVPCTQLRWELWLHLLTLCVCWWLVEIQLWKWAHQCFPLMLSHAANWFCRTACV